MANRRRASIFLLAILLSATSLPFTAHAASGGGGMGDGDVYGESYYLIPGSGEWGIVDTGIANDPMEYSFRLKCFDDVAGDIDCLYENRRECSAGPDGRLVYWLKKLRGSNDPWILHGLGASCIYSEKPRDIGEQIRDSILSEFQSRPIAPGALGLQPAPYTLIGAHTNFFVDAGEQVFEIGRASCRERVF